MIAVAGLIKVALALGGPLKLVGTILLWLSRLLLANPIGLLITAIAAGAYLIWKNWEPIKQWFSGLWGDVKAAFDQGIGGITKLLLDWSPLGLIYKGVVWALEKLGIDLPDKFKTLGGAVVDGLLGGLFGGMDKLKAGIIGLGKNSITWFKDTLGIRSPSRIFAELGINTLQGYQKGLQQQQGPTLQRVGLIAKQVTAAGAGLVMSGTVAASNVAPSALQQQREPWLEQISLIAKQTATNNAGLVKRDAITTSERSIIKRPMAAKSHTGDTISITVHPSPGMNERAIAAQIERMLQERERRKQTQHRANLFDND